MTRLASEVAGLTLAMSAVIALTMLLLRHLGGRFSARCRYLVWSVIIIRLALPFGGELLPALVNVELPAELISSAPDAVGYAPQTVEAERPRATPETVDGIVSSSEVSLQPESRGTFSVDGILSAAGWLYLASAFGFFAWKLIACESYTRRLKKRMRPADESAAALCRKLGANMGIKHLPELYVSEDAQSPLLCGFFRPRVILPDLPLTPNSMVGILAHELMHYRRRDLWLKLAALFALSLHWFNPLVHLASARFAQEMELSCDERVLSGLSDEARLSYGSVMLDIVRRCRRPGETLTTQFNPRSRAVKERFANILDGTRSRRRAWLVAAAVILCTFAGAAVACTVSDDAAVYERFGLKVPLPDEYEGKAEPTSQSKLAENTVIELYHTASGERAPGLGWMFSIVRQTEEQLVPDEYNPGGILYFAERDGWFYLLMRPTSVETDPTDEAVSAEYEALCSLAYRVAEDFRETNGLKAFDSRYISEEGTVKLAYADIDGDGAEEPIILELPADPVAPAVLTVRNASNDVIFREEAGVSHAQRNSLYLCEAGGRSYLLLYDPAMYQGFAS